VVGFWRIGRDETGRGEKFPSNFWGRLGGLRCRNSKKPLDASSHFYPIVCGGKKRPVRNQAYERLAISRCGGRTKKYYKRNGMAGRSERYSPNLRGDRSSIGRGSRSMAEKCYREKDSYILGREREAFLVRFKALKRLIVLFDMVGESSKTL